LAVEKPKVENDREALANKIQNYLNRWTPNSPLNAEMIIETSQASGVPVDFILTVCHAESHCGTKGRAVQTKNPFNVGNTDAGDWKSVVCGRANWCLNSWAEGLAKFTALIKNCYFEEGEKITLTKYIDRDFRAVRCGIQGKRYMTDRNAAAKYLELMHKPGGVLAILYS
jgi:hypothetical protein